MYLCIQYLQIYSTLCPEKFCLFSPPTPHSHLALSNPNMALAFHCPQCCLENIALQTHLLQCAAQFIAGKVHIETAALDHSESSMVFAAGPALLICFLPTQCLDVTLANIPPSSGTQMTPPVPTTFRLTSSAPDLIVFIALTAHLLTRSPLPWFNSLPILPMTHRRPQM